MGSCAEDKFSYSCYLMIYHHLIHIFYIFLLLLSSIASSGFHPFFTIDSMQKCEHKVKGKKFSVWSKRDSYSLLAISWSCVNYCELNAFVYLKYRFASTCLCFWVSQFITQALNLLMVSLGKPVIHKLKLLGGVNLNIIYQWKRSSI